MSTTQYVDIDRTLANLNDTIHPENIAAIEAFVNHAAAEGISAVQQERQIQSLKTMLTRFAPEGFRLRGASETELKDILAQVNRSDYAPATKHKFKGVIKKFYRVENGGKHPEKVDFFTVTQKKATQVTRDDLLTDDELQRLLRGFSNTRDRAFTMVMYETAARPGEALALNIGDFTANEQGDFIFLQGLKNTPDRTNQLIRSGRSVREWLVQHPVGGEIGAVENPSAPLWVKTEQQRCARCGEIPHNHEDSCDYEPNLADRVNYQGFLRRFKQACETADIPDNKRRPYNLRHTRLTEVAKFMGYEQLNKFAGWKPGSDRAKVYVHLTNDDVNRAIREEYGLDGNDHERQQVDCPVCGATNQGKHSECRQCGRPLSLERTIEAEQKQNLLERLEHLEEKGLLDKLDELDA